MQKIKMHRPADCVIGGFQLWRTTASPPRINQIWKIISPQHDYHFQDRLFGKEKQYLTWNQRSSGTVSSSDGGAMRIKDVGYSHGGRRDPRLSRPGSKRCRLLGYCRGRHNRHSRTSDCLGTVYPHYHTIRKSPGSRQLPRDCRPSRRRGNQSGLSLYGGG